MEIKDRQKKRIIDWVGRIGSAATDEDEKRIEEGMDSMKRGPVAAVWDKVLFLWNTFRTDCPAQQKALIIGALAYLILPLDVIPDVLPFAGLIDDAFAVTYVFTAVRKLASKAVPAIEKKADTLIKENVYPLVRAELEGMHRRRLVNSLINLVIFIMSVLLSVFPVFGPLPSAAVASLLLLASAIWALYRTVMAVRRALPVAALMWRERSVKGGLAAYFRTRYDRLAFAEKFADGFFRLLGMNENRKMLDRLVDYAAGLLRRDLVRFVLVELVIAACFLILRQSVIMAAGDTSTLQILLLPFFQLADALR